MRISEATSARSHFGLIRRPVHFLLTLAMLVSFSPGVARAVIIIGNTDSMGKPLGGQNTSAPGGPLARSGWQYEGLWGGDFTATAIAPNYIVTSAHVGAVGSSFVYQGTTYTATDKFLDPNAPDLAIYKINGTLSSYAPIYSGSGEQGSSMITFGRSGPPGTSTTTDGVSLNGWLWQSGTTTLSWGTNVVSLAGPIGGAQYLVWKFDRTLGPNTGALAAGDSGGGVFVQVGGVWYLAGVNYAADGAYNTHPGSAPGTRFFASLYDSRGLYFDGDTTPISGADPVPSQSYATRLSTEIGFIYSVTGVSEPVSIVLMAAGLVGLVPFAWRFRSVA